MMIVLRLVACFAVVSVVSIAGTAHGVAATGRIPPNLSATSGTFTSDIVLTTQGKVAPGNAVTVNLLGLQHDWSGDLIITLSYVDAQGHSTSVDIMNRAGQNQA